MSPAKRAKQPKASLPRPWPLMNAAVQDYRRNWQLLVGVLLIVSLPVAVISNYGASSSGDDALTAYLAFGQLIMNVALIYAVGRIMHGKTLGVRQAYYDGSAMIVRLLLVAAMLILMGIFFFIGVAILAFGVVAPGTVLSAPEQALLIALAVLLAVPSIILLVRGLWAVYIIFETADGPIQALRRSRQLTAGRRTATLGRLAALVGFLIVIMLIPAVGLEVLQGVTHWRIWAVLLQVIATLVVLPLGTLYLYRYYLGLK